mmetsp:Transcript_53126/g.99570  ORF Transcript_53126/g.99570 Transcript_53126/m.99570 type:complete len:430 (+) Transcript_53126:66-1355(+)
MAAMAEAVAIEGNLRLMANCFGAVHAGVGALIVYSTSLFSERCGSIGNGVFYMMTLPGSLLLAVPLLAALGRRSCLTLSFCSYCIYCLLFPIAMSLQQSGQETCTSPGPMLLFLGSSIAGLGAGILWTSQGSYFAHASKLLSRDGEEKACTAWLSGIFAVRYLAWEFAVKLLVSVVQYAEKERLSIAAVSALAIVATAVFVRYEALPGDQERQGIQASQVFDKLVSVVALWPDPSIWLLSPTNIVFGFGSSFMNGYFNADIAAREVGTAFLGAFGAATVASAALSSWAYSSLGATYGKGLPLFCGALAGAITMCLAAGQMSGWKAGILSAYVLWGLSRGSYESVNRAILADTFTGKAIDAAFANFTFQQCIAASVSYLSLSPRVSIGVTIGAASLTMPFYFLAKRRQLEAPEEEGERRYLMEERKPPES